MAGPLGRRAHVLGAQPDRAAARGLRAASPDRPKLLRARHVPVPERRGPARRPPARLHRHRRLRALQAHDRLQRAARDGLRRVRPARRAVRGADRAAPAGHHRGEHRQHAAPAARARARPRPAARRRHHRRRLLPLDAVDLPADLQLLVRRGRRPRPPDRRAGRTSSTPAARDARRRPPCDDARRASSSASSSTRYRLAYLAEAPVNWCPALGTVLANEEVTADGRSERGNYPRVPPPAEAVDAAHHRVRRPAARRPRPARLDRVDQADAAQLDRPQRRRRRSTSRSRGTTTSRSRCSPRGPTRCSARRTWCSRPSTRWSTRSSPTEWPDATLGDDFGDVPAAWKGIFGTDVGPAEAVRRYREFAAQKTRARAPGRGQGEDRRVHRRVRDQPRQRRARSRSSSPTTCSWATAPGRSWRCPRTTSATSSSPASSTCRSSA